MTTKNFLDEALSNKLIYGYSHYDNKLKNTF